MKSVDRDLLVFGGLTISALGITGMVLCANNPALVTATEEVAYQNYKDNPQELAKFEKWKMESIHQSNIIGGVGAIAFGIGGLMIKKGVEG
jgi:hypothetical protein